MCDVLGLLDLDLGNIASDVDRCILSECLGRFSVFVGYIIRYLALYPRRIDAICDVFRKAVVVIVFRLTRYTRGTFFNVDIFGAEDRLVVFYI